MARLVESSEVDPAGSYASLSYCWGGAEILKLQKGNFSDLKQGIAIPSLPPTFRDAIRVVRDLGIQYLWIDSLCIIQDSNEDWQQEARTMLKGYEHAICNIAATHSPNSSGGLFTERNSQTLGSGAVDMDNGVLTGRFHLIDEDYFTREIDDAPLNCRCWVAQERIISSRIIHFASEQVIWDCAELTACESLPQGTKAWPESPSTHMMIGCKQGSTFSTPADTVDQGLGRWARLVDTYSACGLTVLGDKLIAISGVAEYLRNNLNLENDLAPSWSWASVNGSVDLQQVDLYEPYDVKLLVSIIGVDLKRHVEQHRGERRVMFKHGAQSYRLTGPGMEHVKRMWVDDAEIAGSKNLFLVPLFDLQTPYSLQDKGKISSEIRGILVQAVEGKPGTFTRCGHVFLSGRIREDTREFDPSYESLWLTKGEADLPCEEYDAISGHLVTLA
ncbi:hypothetical protein QQX98_000489 [Neonectria punicea]|uniref:Heterokaryon incompatibility domain-containing protein n=1 Tax=Neonectria punicea TaxID=979145 RepID=A0ABR1HTN7_9HYPO